MEQLLLMPALILSLILILGSILAGVLYSKLQGNKRYWMALFVFCIVWYSGCTIFSNYAQKVYTYNTYIYQLKLALDSKNTHSAFYKNFYQKDPAIQEELLEDMTNENIIKIGKYGDMFDMNSKDTRILELYFDTMKNSGIIMLYIIVACLSIIIDFVYTKKISKKIFRADSLDKDIANKISTAEELATRIMKSEEEKENIMIDIQSLQNKYNKLCTQYNDKAKNWESLLSEYSSYVSKINELKNQEIKLRKTCKDLQIITQTDIKTTKKQFDIDDML